MRVKIVSVDRSVAGIFAEERARREAEMSAPPPDDEDDTETALRNLNAMVALSRAYAAGARTRWDEARVTSG